jgi:hypothetical protein
MSRFPLRSKSARVGRSKTNPLVADQTRKTRLHQLSTCALMIRRHCDASRPDRSSHQTSSRRCNTAAAPVAAKATADGRKRNLSNMANLLSNDT